MNETPLIENQWLARQPYESAWLLLQARADTVAEGDASEIIFSCEHEPVYTTGRRGVDNRLGELLPAPVVHSDRGGEMTFHGPGQLMLYPIIHLRQRHIGVKAYVHLLEQSCINVLQSQGIEAARRCGFPGVWTAQGKVAALGVRVTHGVAYHGMALNVDVDPAWFAAINPCGLQSGIVSMSRFVDPLPLPELAAIWMQSFSDLLAAQSN
ncbi:lipoyl(octanoyl) transferase [Mariprofundus sp. EBB-1]|uniref:lipoyl(octanoyl) transferase LipB n=1 Tax=Mariprofundus sp. EBB-1 TaxID=2650971 RepID=UPI000EF181CC|nr:lipoyl(octanoyl) transferase LipB [Mariprofundus sp. EBB-1]RLL55044.1 lipoyl(octanoyl) transferase [Mariprofundus sp. EBB-1]